ncbi:hypothetical protein D3OALGA1CA_4110 [Olavius algarvensis associated proteobacterium Delta 3]|nr:hypothetical protein D3OALGB2SA_1025 [Olavius algarvensis associated proteobacterium Delta 3]CAB5145411.1 hypothetical protein D3OALGA1CA_4110 [Olavius algarvensis associated proteobacterium Delta 3]
MPKQKKMSRKELLKEEDEFLIFSQRLMQGAIQYRMHIAWGVAVFFALVIVIAGYRLITNRAENNAFALLQSATQTYQNELQVRGPEQALEAVTPDVQHILKKYSGRTAGKMARILFAEFAYRGGQPDMAIELYQTALADVATRPVLEGRILSGLGYAYEAKTDYEEAAGYFEKVAAGEGYILRDEALFQMGRLYGLLGQTDRSLAAFKRIADDYPESIYAAIAKEKISVPRENS